MGIYSALEDKWYSLLEVIDKLIPITKVTDNIDSKFPSFVLFLIIIFILLMGFIFFFMGDFFNVNPSYTAEITVLSKIGLPLQGVNVELAGDCKDDFETVNGVTDDEGKIILDVCSDIQNITLCKPGYKTHREEIDIQTNNVFKLSVNEPTIRNITVLIQDERGDLLNDATVDLVCDSNTTHFENQSSQGFLIDIPLNCQVTQLRASAPGYKEKTKTLMDTDERIVLNLEKIILEGKVIFETKTPTVDEAYVEIRLTDSANKSFTEITDASGTKEATLTSGEYSYNAISKKGEPISGTFTVLTNSTETVTILFTDIAVESKKALYVKVVDTSDSPITNAKISIYKDGNSFSSRNTNALGETSPITIDPDTLPAGTKFTGIIKTPGYETKFVELEIVDKSGDPQKIVINQGGAILKVIHEDDVAKKLEDAYTTLYYNGFSEVFDSGTSDKNGEVLFQNLPPGAYTVKSVYTKTDSDGVGTATLSQNGESEITLVLVTGSGNMKFNFINQVNAKIDTNYEFYENIDGMLQKTLSGETLRTYFTTSKIKSRTKVKLKATNPEYFPHETITYQMSRTTQSKDVFLRELNSLPNSNKVQIFLMGVYTTNPLTESISDASAITSGKTYYLYFDVILNNENTDYLLVDFKIGDTNYLTSSISIENAYSIDGYTRVMTKNSNGMIIDNQSGDLVDSNAVQANIVLQNQSGKKSIPVFVEIKVDENALGEESIPLYFRARHGDDVSLRYKKDIIIGESICMFGYDHDCPAFLLSHYLKWNTKDYVPLEYNHTLLIGDDYTIKTTVKNLTDEDIGSAQLKIWIEKAKLNYLTVGEDTNLVLHPVTLTPFDSTAGKETKINLLKKTNSGKVNLSIEKDVDGLNYLADYELNEDQISLKLVDKEELAIEVVPGIIYQDSEYPFFYVKTKYKSQYKGTSAIWYVEKDGVRLGPNYEGQTDVNGIQVTSFDATPFDEGDVITFVAEDLNGNVPARLDITIKNPFPPVIQPEPDCLSVKLNGADINTMTIPMAEVAVNASAQISIQSDCNVDRTVYFHTDLLMSEKQPTIPAGQTVSVNVTGQIRSNILGAYPVQIMSIDGARYKEIDRLDIVVKGSGCFQLDTAILDMRTTDTISAIVKNTCVNGRRDNYYPQVTLGTNSTTIQYNKPGNPETYSFKAKVVGHAIESIVYGFVKSDVMYVSEIGGTGSNPYDTPTVPTEAKSEDEATAACEDLAYDGAYTTKPEPNLPATTPPVNNTYTPSSVVPTEGSTSSIIGDDNTPTTSTSTTTTTTPTVPANPTGTSVSGTGESSTSSSTSSETTASTVGTGGNATASESGEMSLGSTPEGWEEGSCVAAPTSIFFPASGNANTNNSLGCCTQGIGCGPYHASGYTMEYAWGNMTDIYGNATPGAPRPPNFGAGGTWTGVKETGTHVYTVLAVNADTTARIDEAVYAGGGVHYVKYTVKGDDGGRLWHNSDRAYIQNQVDGGRYLEFFKEQTQIWTADVNLVPIEGATYKVATYSAIPTPKWSDEDTLHGYEVGDDWQPSNSYSLYTAACVTPNGFVNPERASGAEAMGEIESFTIKPASDPLVEWDSTGRVMYEIPASSVPAGLRVYLRNGSYYAEYVGVPEISSPNITISFTKKNLLGEEYAILKVKDWTGSSTGEQAFQLKLIGNPSNCYATDGTPGVTGTDFVPKLLFDWDWNNIAYNQCESTNPSYTYCDGVQFNISLTKRLYEINQLLLEGKLNQIPTKTAFYAYLIKDNYSQDLLTDFAAHYSSAFLETGATFSKFKKFFTEHKISYEVLSPTATGTLLEYGGLYRVEIDAARTNENLYSLFDGDNLNATIKVTLRPIEKAPNYNPFYETPFDGDIGDNRNGYGTTVDINGLQLNSKLIADNKGSAAMRKIDFQTSNDLAILNNKLVLSYDGTSNTLQFYPAQPTPVQATITGSIGSVNATYKVEGTNATNMPAQKWRLTSSTIGGAKCNDFTNKETTLVNETVSGTTHKFSWNGIRGGTLGMVTNFFTPKNMTDTIRITPILGNITLNSKTGLTNSTTIMLQNYYQQGLTNYDTLDGIFDMIAEEKLCMSKQADNEVKIFWNPDYLQELESAVTTGSGSSCN